MALKPSRIMTELSPRLDALAAHVLPGLPMADIGTDHARLPVALVARGIAPRALAMDLNLAPLTVAKRTIARAKLDGRVITRQSDGLDALRPGEVATITIAGMGALTMCAMLERVSPLALGARRLILQPNLEAHLLRAHLWRAGLGVSDEFLVEDHGRIYPIFIVDLPPDLSDAPTCFEDLALGAPLRRRGGPLWMRHLEKMRVHWQRRRRGLAQTSPPDADAIEEATRWCDALTCALDQGALVSTSSHASGTSACAGSSAGRDAARRSVSDTNA